MLDQQQRSSMCRWGTVGGKGGEGWEKELRVIESDFPMSLMFDGGRASINNYIDIGSTIHRGYSNSVSLC